MRTVYEAGYFGFWIHRALTRLGVHSMVINPADVPTTDKQRRTKDRPRRCSEARVDHGSVFWAEGGRLTEFGRAMAALGVQLILAGSSQAKGRVERGNRTQQDRLIKAMRRKGISTIGAANHFLERSYNEGHNRQFALPSKDLPDVHCPLDKAIKLEQILCFQTERCLKRDFTITLDAVYIQIEKGPYAFPQPTKYLTVRRYLDDSLHIFNGPEELRYRLLPGKPAPRRTLIVVPAATHPWRVKPPIGKSKRQRRR